MKPDLAADSSTAFAAGVTKPRWPRPPAPLTLLHVASQLLPLSLIVLGCKWHKSLTLGAGASLGDLAVVGAEDAGFLVVYGLLWTALLALARGRWLRVPTTVLFHATTFTLMVLAVVEHGFFVATGTALDWYMVEYGYENFGALKEVIASEVKAPVWVGLGGLVLLAMLPFLLRRLPSVRRVAEREATQGDWRRPWALPLHASLAVGGGVAFGLGSVPIGDDLLALRHNVYLELGGEAARAALSPPPEEIASTGEAVTPLRAIATPRTKRHNVVLIVLESARASAFGPYGGDPTVTPNFARLAARGRVVKNAYTVVPHTSKALVAIQCGLYPKITTPIDEAAPGAIPTDCLAKLLRDKGYATAFYQPAEENFERRRELVANFGFEKFVGREGLAGSGYQTSNYFGYEDDAMLEPALAWVDEARGGEAGEGSPFFLSFLTLTAHHNYQIPSGFARRALSDNPTLDRYLNTIAYTDRFLGKLFDAFEQRGLLEDTVFVVIGDHGEAFGEHKRNQHDNVLYEEGVHVPMMVLGAGVEPGPPIEGLRQNIDVVPTVLDLLGYEIRGGVTAGRSVLDPEGHDRLYFSCWYKDNCMAVREGPRKIVYHFDKRGLEVFHLQDDPAETVNLTAEGGSLGRLEVDAAVEDLKDWRARVNAVYAAGGRSLKERYVSRERPRPQVPMDVMLGEHIRLLGYDVESTTLEVGVPAVVTYYFEALSNPGPGARIFAHLDGPRFLNVDYVSVEGTYPPSKWQPGEFIEDRHTFRINPGRPAGTYKLKIGLWNENASGKGLEARALPRGEGVEIDDKRRVTIATFVATEPPKAKK